MLENLKISSNVQDFSARLEVSRENGDGQLGVMIEGLLDCMRGLHIDRR